MLPELFCEKMKTLLGEEYEAFLAALDRPRAVGLRVNPLKASLRDKSADWSWPSVASAILNSQFSIFKLAPVPWCPTGFYYDETARPGLHPYHAAGAYYLQEPSAMAPVELLNPQPGERVLDLCAAPGGKSTQIAGKLLGRGLLICNEIHPKRAGILASNLERLGIANALVLNEHPARLAERFPTYFDRILVDAPCSGEGMFRKHDAAFEDWSPETVAMCARRQAEILDCAAAMLKPGGRLVYSTCTFNRPENEGSILGFLDRHPDFSPEDFALSSVGPSEGGMLRLWPHRLRGDGHFVARLRKAGAPGEAKAPGPKADREAAELLSGLCREACLTIPTAWRFSTVRPGQRENLLPARRGDRLFLLSADAPDTAGLRVVSPGLCVARIGRSHIEPEHALAMALPPRLAQRRVLLPDAQALAFLRGEALHAAGDRGWTLVAWRGLPLGWGKAVDGTLKNHLPKGLRRLG